MATETSAPSTPVRVFESYQEPYDETRFLSGHGARATIILIDDVRTLQVTIDPTAEPAPSALNTSGIGATVWSPIFWDLAEFEAVEVPVTNQSSSTLQVEVHLENGEAKDGPRFRNSMTTGIEAGETTTISVPIQGMRRTPEQAGLLGLRGLPASDDPTGRIVPERIERIRILVADAKEGDQFLVHALRATGQVADPARATLPSNPDWFPFIDTFGQYKHADWEGKIQDLPQLEEAWNTESADIAASQLPSSFSRFGGSTTTGVQLEATGRFRTEQIDGRWTLVDPEGYPFFSMGVNSLRFGTDTPIDQREDWFENPPWEDPAFADLIVPAGRGRILRGGYEGTQPRRFAFYQANVQRRYGADWTEPARKHILKRLWSWGLNTIGSWSDQPLVAWEGEDRAPFAVLASSDGCRRIEGSHGFWRKFPDVFDPSFRTKVAENLEKQRAQITSPWCVGVYIDNEHDWGYVDGVPFLSPGILASPADQPAKVAMRDLLQQRHGSIDALNARWGTSVASWDRWLDLSSDDVDRKRAEVIEDLLAMEDHLIERYFEVSHEELRKVDADVLYMGCRFSGRAPDRLVKVASQYCDVLSYNLYWRSLSHLQLPGGYDRPILISEFHFGTLGANHFHPGLIAADGPEAVAALLDNYLREGLAHDQVIGFHWFQWADQPNTGRTLDGENYGVGLVTVTDLPHQHLIDTIRTFMQDAYAPGGLVP